MPKNDADTRKRLFWNLKQTIKVYFDRWIRALSPTLDVTDCDLGWFLQGIDPFSLDMFAKEGIVALRRAKRRNMER